jgi:ketosteroid isomerase-like protein
VELVRSIFADWERGDFSWADWAHPEAEFVWVGGSIPGTFRGRAEVSKTFAERMSAWEDPRIEANEYRELDDERVFVFFSLSGGGKASGFDLGELRRQYASVLHVRDGKVTRVVTCWDRDRALADLGSEG